MFGLSIASLRSLYRLMWIVQLTLLAGIAGAGVTGLWAQAEIRRQEAYKEADDKPKGGRSARHSI